MSKKDQSASTPQPSSGTAAKPASPSGPPPIAGSVESRGEKPTKSMPPEYGGRKGPEATRYGDWENGGKCVDF